MLGASVALAGEQMALPPLFYLSLFGTVADFFQVGRHAPSVTYLAVQPNMARAKATGGRRPYLKTRAWRRVSSWPSYLLRPFLLTPTPL